LPLDCGLLGARGLRRPRVHGTLTHEQEVDVATLKRGKQGTTMQGVEISPIRRMRMKKRRAAQEGRWAKRSGEVKTRSLDELSEDERRQLGL